MGERNAFTSSLEPVGKFFFFVIFLPFSLLMFTVPLSSAPASLDFLALFFQLPQAYT